MDPVWSNTRETYIEAVGQDSVAADVVAFLYDLTETHEGLWLRPGKGVRPTFMADVRAGKRGPYLFSVSPATKLVYFVPHRIDSLIGKRDPYWFTSYLKRALEPVLRDPGIGHYLDIYMADLAPRTDTMRDLVRDSVAQIGASITSRTSHG
ncbi:MAG: hypothetical protein U0893_12455 [Chloroflexota bacterium]